MTLSMLVTGANPVVSGKNVEGMNWKALGSHRCYMENTSV